jgi:hypothetical protein
MVSKTTVSETTLALCLRDSLLINWLRVLDTAECSQVDQRANAANSVAESWTGIGVVVGFCASALMVQWLHLKGVDCIS